MGVRVIEADSASDSYDDDDCSKCNKEQHKAPNKPKSGNGKRSPSPPEGASYISKDLVGNCKEYRIENNTRDLRIIGNCNRIRIVSNTGYLQVIGNATRLKIQSNSGSIKYTGNDGRIYLGSDSQQQSVDYTGCNGLLKVVKSLDLESSGKKPSKRTHTPKFKETPKQTPSMGIEIDNNLTIVNGVAGNIVIKNAINVSI
ncbi:GL11274 [Drosophila persimilis]|uniref:Uncharacterized protein pirk n=2 Tax=pseudoobscura subgroup TaxID=32358 RepID=A0A6I8USU8_DROPS|nr:uncharacterized protein LOC4803698 [Drosophila pseudoobscura]XP_002015844.1 uncharacterized protein LOC6590364 [Drosophila persimilis]EDW31734.1 GL11274 [Drosophila persimilis]